MDHRRSLLLLALLALGPVSTLASQRGRRRPPPPPEVVERWGNYFTRISLRTGAQNAFVEKLSLTDHVQNAVKAGQMSLIYLYDSGDNPRKRESFERTIFNHNKINPGLRLFKCGRVDMARNLPVRKKLAPVLPAFAVFTKSGRQVSIVPFEKYRAVPANLVRVMKAAAKGYNKTGWDNWVRNYGKFVRDTNNLIAHEKILAGKRQRIGDRTDSSAKTTLAKVEVDERKLKKRMEEHFAREKKLLERAKVPERDPDAELVGGPRELERGWGR